LSGGQQQRVGVARALAARPRIVLMDEPFGALDPLTRESLQHSLKAIQRDSGTTILFVTHDMDEAFSLGDRVGLMLDGKLAQVGTPLQLIRDPASERVREFVGGMRARLRELAVRSVRESARAGEHADGDALDIAVSLQDALASMLAQGRDRLPVEEHGRPFGIIRLADLVAPRP
jgi:osmoprotectant transport system ATP-binding protein